ncbi:MAG TPA: hypothetical protein VHO70_21315 [Chitinispirillaceae bacterium]|nr:hypothetical protein [Chitinispirillaceae bacterium]
MQQHPEKEQNHYLRMNGKKIFSRTALLLLLSFQLAKAVYTAPDTLTHFSYRTAATDKKVNFQFTAPAPGNYFAVLTCGDDYASISYYGTDASFGNAILSEEFTSYYMVKFNATEGQKHYFTVFEPWAGVTPEGFNFCVRPISELTIKATAPDASTKDTVLLFPDGIPTVPSWTPLKGTRFAKWEKLSGEVEIVEPQNIRSEIKITGDAVVGAVLENVRIMPVQTGVDTFTFSQNSYDGTAGNGIILSFKPPHTGRYTFYPMKDRFNYCIGPSIQSVTDCDVKMGWYNEYICFIATSIDTLFYLKVLSNNPVVGIGETDLVLAIDTTEHVTVSVDGDAYFVATWPKRISITPEKGYRLDSIKVLDGVATINASLITLKSNSRIKAYASQQPVYSLSHEWKIYNAYISRYDAESVAFSFTPAVTDSYTVSTVFPKEEYGFIVQVPDVKQSWYDTKAEGKSPLDYTFAGTAGLDSYFRIRPGKVAQNVCIAAIIVKKGETTPPAPDISCSTNSVMRLPLQEQLIHSSQVKITRQNKNIIMHCSDGIKTARLILLDGRSIPAAAGNAGTSLTINTHNCAKGICILEMVSRNGKIIREKIFSQP